jgi:hypothetical protein
MTISKLRKILRNRIELNPFNDKFQEDHFLNIIISEVNLNDLKNDILSDTVKLLTWLNQHYRDFYSHLKTNLKESNVPYDVLLDLLFVSFNRNFLILSQQIAEKHKGNDEFREKAFFSHKIESKSGSKVEARTALETDIDAFIYVLNFVRYIKPEDIPVDDLKQETIAINNSYNIQSLSKYYALLKVLYDDSVWSTGYWKISEGGTKPVFNVIFPDNNLLLVYQTGLLRFQRNLSSYYYTNYIQIKSNSAYGQLLFNSIKSKYKEKRIKNVVIRKGFIVYDIAKGFGVNEICEELKNRTAINTFYSYMKNVKFDSMEGLTLMDLVTLFSLLQDLSNKTVEIKFDDSINSIHDLDKFPIKIKSEDLINYFLQRSVYNHKQVKIFLELVSYNYGDRIDLWERPLVKYNNVYYLCFLPLVAPVLLNLLDHWIEVGGFTLDKRGAYLEDYLVQSCSNLLKKKGFHHQIPKNKKYYNRNGFFEEIDLILILKHVVVVAEVKCIKYPYDSRDRHNSLRRLSEGVKQVARKTNFLKDWYSEISILSNELVGKELIPIVITNYPLYTGYEIDGVPIIDFCLLEGFFSSGKMTENKIFPDGRREIIKQHIYYKNENEMNASLKTFFRKPYPVEELAAYFEIIDQKLSFDNFGYELYATAAVISESFNPNE